MPPRLILSCLVTLALQGPLSNGAASPLLISYSLAKPGKVSIIVTDAQGRIVRELAHAVPRPAGPHQEAWDTRDDQGAPVPPGNYTWKMLATPGLKAHYEMSIGSSYPLGDGDPWWALGGPGSHGGPQAVTVDGTGFYVAAFTENIEPCLIKLSLDGAHRLWSAPAPAAWEGGSALASANGKLYMLGKGRAWIYDAATGAKERALDLTWREGLGPAQSPTDLSVAAGRLTAVYREAGLVRWMDSGTGAEVARAEVPGVRSVALGSDGQTAFVTTGSSILRVLPGGAPPEAVVEGLDQPERLRLDTVRNELAVYQAGTKQISRFDTHGRPHGSLGARGGRHPGPFGPESQRSFIGVTDLDLRSGELWVAEAVAAPRRVAHFDPDGHLVGAWYGGQVWAPWVAPDPADANIVWMPSQWGSMMRLVLDRQAKRWSVHSTYQFDGLAAGLVGNHRNAQLWEARRLNGGQLYLFRLGDAPCVLRVDETNWRLVPVTVGFRHIQAYRAELPPFLVDWSKGRDAALWTDANGDGLPQPGEIAWFASSGGYTGGGSTVDGAGNYLQVQDGIAEYPLTGWNSAGSPTYAKFPAGEIVASLPTRFKGGDPRWSAFLERNPRGELVAALNSNLTGWGQSKDSFLAHYDLGNHEVWEAGSRGSSPGQTDAFRRILGDVHGCVAVTNFSHEWAQDGFPETYVWDADGLWVGGLFDDPDLDGIPAALYAAGGESLAGVIREDPVSGDALLYQNWLNEIRLYRISGWSGWERASGVLHLTMTAPPQPEQADPWAEVPPGTGQGLLGSYWSNSTWSGAPALRRIESADIDLGIQGKQRPAEIAHGPYSASWTGFIEARRTGPYLFRLERARTQLEVDGVVLAGDLGGPDSFFPAPKAAAADGAIRLEAGKRYPIQIRFTDQYIHPSVDQGVQLRWRQPGDRLWETVPRSQLTTPTGSESNPTRE